MASPAPVGLRIVLLLNNPFVADSRSWKLARSLSDVGCDVTVVARRADGLPDREGREGFRVVRLEQPRPLGWLPMPALPEGAGTDERRPRIGRAGRVAGGVIDALGRVAQAGRYLLLARQWA